MNIHDDIVSTVGKTQRGRIRKLIRGGGSVLAKLESPPPLTSVKDRIGASMIGYRVKTSLSREAAAEDVLRWTLEKFHPRLAIASSLQDSILVHMAVGIRKDVRVFSIDTGRLPEEAYLCAEDIRRQFGVRIEWYLPMHDAVEKLETEKGLYSFKDSLDMRKECCFIRKVEPLGRALAGLDAWITGMRRDESVTRSALALIETDEGHGGIVKINPLADWTLDDVRAYLGKHRIPYNRLLDRGYPSIGCACCTRPIEPGEDARAGRWWWEQPEHKECGLHSRVGASGTGRKA